VTQKKVNIFLIILSLIGLAVSIYLWYLYGRPYRIECTLSDCQSVRESEYSKLLGISLPILGTLYYAGLIVYLVFRTIKPELIKINYEDVLVTLATSFGFIFSLYLTFIEAFIIDAFCQWCLISALVASLIFVWSVLRFKMK
jgi:uncharacterized membrane protein